MRHALLAHRAEGKTDEAAVPARADGEELSALRSVDEDDGSRPVCDDAVELDAALRVGDLGADRVERLHALLAENVGLEILRGAESASREIGVAPGVDRPHTAYEVLQRTSDGPAAAGPSLDWD